MLDDQDALVTELRATMASAVARLQSAIDDNSVVSANNWAEVAKTLSETLEKTPR